MKSCTCLRRRKGARHKDGCPAIRAQVSTPHAVRVARDPNYGKAANANRIHVPDDRYRGLIRRSIEEDRIHEAATALEAMFLRDGGGPYVY